MVKIMLVRESIDDILKPKDQKQIIRDLAQEVMLELLEGSVDFYFKSFKQYNIWNSTELKIIGICKEDIFNEYNKKFGPGLYVIFNNYLIKDIPMKNIYSNRTIITEPKTIQYNLQATELESAIQELIAQVITGNLGDGFILKYFNE